MRISIRHWLSGKKFWEDGPSEPVWTQLKTRVNRRLQYYGERYRSWRAWRESDANTSMPFPYHTPQYLRSFETNKLFAEPDFEPYWENLQRLIYLEAAYRRAPLMQGYSVRYEGGIDYVS